MKAWRGLLGMAVFAVGFGASCAQTPVLGGIEAPYPALQSQVSMAGRTYLPGSVTYGPAGTPLVLTGSDLGASGTVQFVGYKNGAVDPGATVQATTVTMWTSNMIFLTVPAGAVSGLVTVTVEGKNSNGIPFMVMPGNYNSASCPAFPPTSQLQITTSSLHDGTAGQAYSATLGETGGTAPYTWSIAGGTLPTGLSLNSSTGVISGTPSNAAGPLSLTVQVADSSSPQQTNEAVLSLTIESQTLVSAAVYSYCVPGPSNSNPNSACTTSTSGFDGVGNITKHIDQVMGTWNFTYDSLNRLVSGTISAGVYAGQYACWSYDSFGNRIAESLSATACANNPPLTSWATYTTSNTNRMDSTGQNSNQANGYDGAGDVTYDGVNTYIYDIEGRICAVKSEPILGTYSMTGYLYDAEGRRIAKGAITTWGGCDPAVNGFTLTESYVLGQGGQELAMFDGNNNWQRANVYGAGKLLGTYDVNGLHFHVTDPLGTRRMQFSSVGQPETDIQSLPFGDQLYSFLDQHAPATADDAAPLYFTSKERDTETGFANGNDYFGARYYASSMGRWMSPDFNEDDDDPEPVPYANLENPQSLDLYSYVGNNPLGRADSTGHFYNGLQCGCPDTSEEDRRLWLELQWTIILAWEMEKQRILHPFSYPFKPTTPPVVAPGQSTPADPNQNKPKFEPNKGKHHQNAKGKASSEPANSEELYKKAIKSNDKPGTWWAQDSDGVLHRFSSDNAGGAHWSGSTGGENGIESQNIPGDIKKAFGWTK